MKVSDYIVSFLIKNQITDVFGYPGGMVTHLMDSLAARRQEIRAHVTYHEQGAAFAACGYAQVALRPGVAYATSGPGATNLLTGICNAFFDSIPCIFITGQVNTYEGKASLPLRQKGFQEMDVVRLCQSVTKYAAAVEDAADIRLQLEKAYYLAMEGRPGPVVLDIPMNVQRAEVEPEQLAGFVPPVPDAADPARAAHDICIALAEAKRPCILAGAGVQGAGVGEAFRQFAQKAGVPVVSSMLAIDILPQSPLYYGFAGAYGMRYANFILAKSDLIVSMGTRMDLRQIGADAAQFAPHARLLRIDIDDDELVNKIKPDETVIKINLQSLVPALEDAPGPFAPHAAWLGVCDTLRDALKGVDDREPNRVVAALSRRIDPDTVVTTDVGQNQMWAAQSFEAKGQRVLFSGGHGAMGYSLPAAIGAHYGSGKKVVAFCGDGGIQMNIQELQFLARERLPIAIVLLNNHALGMIRHFQEMYFEGRYTQTRPEGGYLPPDFEALAKAYQIGYRRIEGEGGLDALPESLITEQCGPVLYEVVLSGDTYVFPKLAMGKQNQDQDPELDRALYRRLEEL